MYYSPYKLINKEAMKKQTIKKYSLNLLSSTAALSLLFLSILPVLFGPATAYAGTIEPRSIQMSASNPGQSSVTYNVTWTPASTTSIGGVVVDFCSNTPIVGATCTAPTGFTTGGTSAAVSGYTNMGTGWTVSSSSTVSTLILNNTTAQTQSTSLPDSVVVTSVTNPTAVGTFYARILTFSTAADANAYSATTTPTSLTGLIDYGGIALSTAAEIDISATVQEALAFCVYVTSCSTTATSVSIPLGHLVNGVTVVDSQAVYASPINFSITTNALNGVAVNLYGGTLTDAAGLTIPPVGSTAEGITVGTAAFGLYLSTLGTGVTATAPYSSLSTCGSGTGVGTGTAACYALNTTTSPDTLSTYGEQIAQMASPENDSISTVTYGVTASPTTPSGVYAATQQLIATGSF